MSEVNTDLAPCALAVHQAIGIWNLQAAHALTPADRAPTPGLLGDDQSACSYTSEYIYDLSDIQVPGTTAGKDVGQVIATATLWTTSDALGAIEDVQTLMNNPNDAAALRNLSKEEAQLAADRRTAISRGGRSRPSARHPPAARRPPRRLRSRAPAEARSGRWRRTALPPGGRRHSPPPLGPGEGQELGVGVLVGLQPHDGVPEDHRDEGQRRPRTRARPTRSAGRPRRSDRPPRGGSCGRSRDWRGRPRRRGSRRPTSTRAAQHRSAQVSRAGHQGRRRHQLEPEAEPEHEEAGALERHQPAVPGHRGDRARRVPGHDDAEVGGDEGQ